MFSKHEIKKAAWTVGIVALSAYAVSRLLPGLAMRVGLLVELVGQYDQSVGSETQGTEGNSSLIQALQMNLDGVPRRVMPGAVLFELDRIIAGGAMPKVDPTVGVASNKVFSSKLFYP